MFLKYQLYLLQLENYQLSGYWRAGWRSVWRKPPAAWRKKLVWTLKMKAVVALAVLLGVLAAVAGFWLSGFLILPSLGLKILFLLVWLCVLFRFFFVVFLTLAVILLWPADWFLKRRLVGKAKKKIAASSNLKIIAIAGSYGKTTMKEMLAAVLGEKFRVLKTPENVNTPVGIARLILSQLKNDTEIFIVEMGAYGRGDIKALCRLTPPAIGILTGINESHLARFGSLKNTMAAKFEIIDALKPGGLAVLNADSELVVKNYQNHLKNQKTFFYTASRHPLALYQISRQEFRTETGGSVFELVNQKGWPEKFKTDFLGEYIAGDIMACFIIGRELGLTVDQIKVGAALCRPIEHRLKHFILPRGAIMIDDSYNGNPAGVEEAIKVLSRFQNRRKIYLTPGLVEIGSQMRPVHEKIGEILSGAADLVILIKNSVTPFIAAGLTKNNFSKDKIIWLKKMNEASDWLAKNLSPRDIILFQNDWPENYR